MIVTLEKKEVVKLFCHCRQAERSIHRVLGAQWPELQVYYADHRREIVRETIEFLQNHYPECNFRPGSREQLSSSVHYPGMFKVLFGPWISRRKKSWAFTWEEISFISLTLSKFLKLLNAPGRPDDSCLISLRQDLYFGEYIIECRCYGLSELITACSIEHFLQSEGTKVVRLKDILAEAA